jgi:DNA-binding NarL/FixJ family response regulator
LTGRPGGAPTDAAPRVFIIEDHELLAQSVGLVLSNEGYDVTLSRLTSMAAVLAEVAELRPQVVILDLDLGGSLGDGVGLVQPLCAKGARVLVVTAATEEHRLGLCLAEGAAGVLSKRFTLEELLEAVRATVAGQAPMSEWNRLDLLKALRSWRAEQDQLFAPFTRLTPRERQVLACMLEATVRSQIRGVLTKLGVSSQLAAVALARRAAWQLPEAG